MGYWKNLDYLTNFYAGHLEACLEEQIGSELLDMSFEDIVLKITKEVTQEETEDLLYSLLTGSDFVDILQPILDRVGEYLAIKELETPRD